MSEGPKPITRQRSEWIKLKDDEILGFPNQWFGRRTSDGQLVACVAEEPQGWHLSISFSNHRREHTRYPSWDEQVHAVRALLPPDLTYVMVLPPDAEYVAVHDTTMHWHEHPERT